MNTDRTREGLVKFLFEAVHLAKTPRSGFIFLDRSVRQSVAEHTCGTVFVGYTLAQMIPGADLCKVMQMCLFHDLAEARASDLSYLNQKYNRRFELRARKDLAKTIPFGKSMLKILKEFEKSETVEAKIVRDADQLELLLLLKELMDVGNQQAKDWVPSLLLRLKTEEGKALADQILKTPYNNWWFEDKNDPHWVNPTIKSR